MSKHETPMTRWFWQQVGGTLIEEFCAVRKGAGCDAGGLGRLSVLGTGTSEITTQ